MFVVNNRQASWEPSRIKPDTSLHAAELKEMRKSDNTITANGHHDSALMRTAFSQNGHDFPSDRLMSEMKEKYCHCERQEKAKAAESSEDSFRKGGRDGSESYEARRMKDLSPTEEKDCNNVGDSKTPKIVPLKPRRSKKSLNKENQDGVHAAGCGGVTPCESARSLDDHAGPHSTQPCQHTKNQQLPKQELKERREATVQGQWTRGGVLREDHFHNISEFCSKFSAPPRTLPLKMHWSRDRPSSVDSSHIHYRTPNPEPAKRKPAVKPRLSITGK